MVHFKLLLTKHNFQKSTVSLGFLYLHSRLYKVTLLVSDCAFPPALDVNINPGLSCYIPASCTGIHVCADVPILGKPVLAYLELDDCTQVLKIGIENYRFEVIFADIEFGE